MAVNEPESVASAREELLPLLPELGGTRCRHTEEETRTMVLVADFLARVEAGVVESAGRE